MLVESIKFSNFLQWSQFGTGSDRGVRARFYDENNNLIESGNVISNSQYGAETENFIISANCGSWHHNLSHYFPLEAFRTDVEKEIMPTSSSHGCWGCWI